MAVMLLNVPNDDANEVAAKRVRLVVASSSSSGGILDKNVDDLLESIFLDIDARSQKKMKQNDGKSEVCVQTEAVQVYNAEEWQEAEKNKMQEFETIAREAMAQNLLTQDGILQNRMDEMIEMVNKKWTVKCRAAMDEMLEENARLKVENAKLAKQIDDGVGMMVLA